jgi:hypothetical protein
VFFAEVVANLVGSQQDPVLADLDGIGNDGHSNGLAPVSVADPIAGPGERDCSA